VQQSKQQSNLFALRLRVSQVSADEAFAEVREADAHSFIETGSHDESCVIVSVNHVGRRVRRWEWNWFSVTNGYEHAESVAAEPDPLPDVAEIQHMAILRRIWHKNPEGEGDEEPASLTIFAQLPDGRYERRHYHNNADAIVRAHYDGVTPPRGTIARFRAKDASGFIYHDILDEAALIPTYGAPVIEETR
jgi:hypothetical protein